MINSSHIVDRKISLFNVTALYSEPLKTKLFPMKLCSCSIFPSHYASAVSLSSILMHASHNKNQQIVVMIFIEGTVCCEFIPNFPAKIWCNPISYTLLTLAPCTIKHIAYLGDLSKLAVSAALARNQVTCGKVTVGLALEFVGFTQFRILLSLN